MQRHGIVYIAEELADALVPGPTRFYGHWEADDSRGVLEQGPGWEDVEAAVPSASRRHRALAAALARYAPSLQYVAAR
jgi:hypothetical protein